MDVREARAIKEHARVRGWVVAALEAASRSSPPGHKRDASHDETSKYMNLGDLARRALRELGLGDE